MLYFQLINKKLGLHQILEIELTKIKQNPKIKLRNESPIHADSSSTRSYSRIHGVRYVRRSHDKSNNRHCPTNKQCANCSDFVTKVAKTKQQINYSSISANKLLRQLICEEIALIRMFLFLVESIN